MEIQSNPPDALLQSIRSENCILFLGAGLGYNLANESGDNCPDGQTLAKRMCNEFNLNTNTDDLSVASELVELRCKGRGPLLDFLRKQLLGYEPDEYYQWIPSIPWRAIYTTNFDDGLLTAFRKSSDAPRNIVPIYVTSDFRDFSLYTDVPVYYIHGCLNQPGLPLVITQSDYSLFREKRRMMFEQLKIHHTQCPFVYIGYSHKDNNWQMVHSEMLSEFSEGRLPRSFRIDPFPDSGQAEILESKGIETIACDLKKLVIEYRDYSSTQGEANRIWDLSDQLPSVFHEAFKNAPAMCTRFLRSWEYVGAADLQARPNHSEYYKGTKANWSLIEAGGNFERDIEDSIFDDILDFATDPKKRCIFEIILGSAGYGISTVLMSIAWKSVKTKLMHVLYLRDGATILEGDIQFALNNLTGKFLFILDRANKYPERINEIAIQCRNDNRDCFFLLGSRLNEWRQEFPRLKCKEQLLEPLSESEIDRLIDTLNKNNSLGNLANLKDDFRRKILINKHKQELLVIMRETVENNSFDAILESEHDGIANDDMKKVYGFIAGMHQYDVMPRISLISDMAKYNIADIPSLISKFAEGIIRIIEDPIMVDVLCLVTRHRIIAKVIWHKCLLGAEREQFLLILMKHLNLAYRQDKETFEALTKDDDIVDSIKSFESKTSFFEAACKKDILNPYVRQHYARMLLREKKYSLALSQIETGLKIDKQNRILYHTQGQILSKMAIEADVKNIGEKYMDRAVASYQACIKMNESDDYGYQSLAQLYLEWATKWDDKDTFTKYINRCEEVISTGLRVVRKRRDSLLLVSSNIEKVLGDKPKGLQLIEKALIENPNSIICRYMLAREAFNKEKFDRVIELLDPTITSHFDEIRSYLLYAKSVSSIDKNYTRAIAVLKQADPIAWSDPTYVATIGGMHALSRSISDSEKVFEDAKKQSFPEEEAREIKFRPVNLEYPKSDLLIRGNVIVRRAGYLLIQSQQFGKFLFPSPKIGGSYISEQTTVEFQPVFSGKGGIAQNPKVVSA